jgi:hypothetical protein
MGRDNLTWGQRRIANELRLKLGLQVSPRTIRKYLPERRDRGPGTRVPSQRWRTFVRNHACELIVRGMAMDLLTRGAETRLARMRQCRHCWWGRSIVRGWQGSTPREAVAIALLRDIRSVPAAWALGTMEVISKDDRSPPDTRPSCHDDSCTATRVTLVVTLDLRPVVRARYWWNRASASPRSAEPLSQSAPHAVPVWRVA